MVLDPLVPDLGVCPGCPQPLRASTTAAVLLAAHPGASGVITGRLCAAREGMLIALFVICLNVFF